MIERYSCKFSDGTILYWSKGICPKCFLSDKKVSLSSAAVIVKNSSVVLEIECGKGEHEKVCAVYSSDVAFYLKLFKYESALFSKESIEDIEDLEKMHSFLDAQSRKESSFGIPLILEVDAFSEQTLLTVEQLVSSINTLRGESEVKSETSRHYIMKVNGGPIRDKATLLQFNDLVLCFALILC